MDLPDGPVPDWSAYTPAADGAPTAIVDRSAVSLPLLRPHRDGSGIAVVDLSSAQLQLPVRA